MPKLKAYLTTWEQEFKTTVRVFESYPSDRLNYRPHEISKTALELMWAIAFEEGDVLEGCLRGKITYHPAKPAKTKEALLRQYKKTHAALVKKVKRAGEALFAKTIRFYVAKDTIGDINVGDMLWFLLHDQIHHRGQLSVYLRLVGAKVPSIYGPSADEPW